LLIWVKRIPNRQKRHLCLCVACSADLELQLGRELSRSFERRSSLDTALYTDHYYYYYFALECHIRTQNQLDTNGGIFVLNGLILNVLLGLTRRCCFQMAWTKWTSRVDLIREVRRFRLSEDKKRIFIENLTGGVPDGLPEPDRTRHTLIYNEYVITHRLSLNESKRPLISWLTPCKL
jgi:hypothetical protein